MIGSSSTHISTNDPISFLSWLSNIPLYIHIPHLSPYLSLSLSPPGLPDIPKVKTKFFNMALQALHELCSWSLLKPHLTLPPTSLYGFLLTSAFPGFLRISRTMQPHDLYLYLNTPFISPHIHLIS